MTSLVKTAAQISRGIAARRVKTLDERVLEITWPRKLEEMDPLVLALIRARLERRLSRRALAALIIARCGPMSGRNITERAIIAYERGDRLPGIDRARRWARALDIEIISVQHVTR